MAPADFNFDRDFLPVVEKLAKRQFSGHPRIDEMVCDVVSMTWEFWKDAPQISPRAHAWYAVKQVRIGRQFSQSSRSFDGPNPRRKKRPTKANFDLRAVAKVGDNPAEIVIVTVDGKSFRANLSKVDRRYFDCFLTGMTTSEIAELFGVTRGAVSQRRRSTVEKWQAYTA